MRVMRDGKWLVSDAGITVRNVWDDVARKISAWLQDEIMWQSVAVMLVRILLIWMISRILLRIINRLIDRFTSGRSRLKVRSRKAQTVGRLLKNAAAYAVNFIMILLILGEFHINLAPLLATDLLGLELPGLIKNFQAIQYQPLWFDMLGVGLLLAGILIFLKMANHRGINLIAD